MSMFKHLLSTISVFWCALNLGFWMFPLFPVALIKLLIGNHGSVRRFCDLTLEWIYKCAVRINSFWLIRMMGIKVETEGRLPDHPAPIILVNHQSWFDIPLLHHVVTGQGPILKFLIKRELLWLPIVGWLCYALNFPALHRGQGKRARKKDYESIQAFSSTLNNERGGLLIYAEGTRFTPLKKAQQKSPYEHLLTPKAGGLKIALAAVTDDTPVVDLTLVYVGGETNFWRCMHGATRHIRVHIKHFRAGDIKDPNAWLAERWTEKDLLF